MGSFFHYAEGFTRPEAYDLTLPELNPVGKIKDVLFPSPRLDFYACVEARKRKDSKHGPLTPREPPGTVQTVDGAQYLPKVVENPVTKERRLGPFY